MKRRDFLKISTLGMVWSAGLPAAIAWSPRAHAATISRTLYITEGYIAQPDTVNVYFRGFSNASGALQVPAQPLIVSEGDLVRITIRNTLRSSHSFVINGLVDSGTISGGQTKTVEFVASKAGSYLFYDKLNAPYNRLLGLHGALAVMPSGKSDELYSGSPKFKKQYFWVFNEIDPVWHEAVRNGRTPSTAFIPRYFTINGRSGRPPGADGYGDPAIDAGYNYDTRLVGRIGDRSLIRVLNAGNCVHSLHWHGNHVEWLTENGTIRPDIWLKDVVRLDNNLGKFDVIYPFEPPPDAYPPVMHGHYVMHLHDEQTQTAGGGLYQFGAQTMIVFER